MKPHLKNIRPGIGLISTVCITLVTANVVSAQNYPNKPIRMVTTAPAGGSALAARLIAPGLTTSLGQQVVVDSRGNVAAEIVAKSAPDGYTLLVYGSTVWLAPLLSDMPYDPVRDFTPVSLVSNSPNVLVVNPALGVKSVKELIALARAKPGALNYGASGIGSSLHLAPEMFKAMAGVNIVHVNYKGSGQALTDLIGGQVQLMFPVGPSVVPHIKSGRLRALAVTSAQPTPQFPDLPTVAASGLPGYETVSRSGILAPAKTSMTIINRLHQEIVRAMTNPDVRETFFNGGADVVASTPAQFAAAIKSDMTRMGKVIKDAGIRAD